VGVIATLLLAAAFPGNGLHCFGSPGATGDLLPSARGQYIAEISVMLKGRTQTPVGWLYTSNEGKRFTQRTTAGPVMPYSRTRDDTDVRLFACTLPMKLDDLP
jgi:hypothetical protein